MQVPILTSFLDVIWWMLIVFFWTMVLWMFIALFADIIRRHDLSGWGKAAWLVALIFLPFLGALIYIIARPSTAAVESPDQYTGDPYAGATNSSSASSSASEITQAQQLMQSGAITQTEYDQLKRKALA